MCSHWFKINYAQRIIIPRQSDFLHSKRNRLAYLGVVGSSEAVISIRGRRHVRCRSVVATRTYRRDDMSIEITMIDICIVRVAAML